MADTEEVVETEEEEKPVTEVAETVEDEKKTPVEDAVDEVAEKPDDETEAEPSTEESADFWRGKCEALKEAQATEVVDDTDTQIESVENQIAAKLTEVQACVADKLMDEEEVREQVAKKDTLRDELEVLREERFTLRKSKEDKVAGIAAHVECLKAAMRDPVIKLPPSRFNELDERVRARFRREGYTETNSPTAEHYEAIVEAEALRLKASIKPRKKADPSPKPSVGAGGDADLPFEKIQKGTLDDVARQMQALGM